MLGWGGRTDGPVDLDNVDSKNLKMSCTTRFTRDRIDDIHKNLENVYYENQNILGPSPH